MIYVPAGGPPEFPLAATFSGPVEPATSATMLHINKNRIRATVLYFPFKCGGRGAQRGAEGKPQLVFHQNNLNELDLGTRRPPVAFLSFLPPPSGLSARSPCSAFKLRLLSVYSFTFHPFTSTPTAFLRAYVQGIGAEAHEDRPWNRMHSARCGAT